jgi:uncharacterized membrane protein
MTRDVIDVQYPVLDHTESVANIAITKTTVTVANGITIKDAFSNKNNSLFIIIDNTTNASSLLTVKAGDAYPNSMLGDIVIELAKGVSAIQLEDLSRFQKSDESIDLDFGTGFEGTVYAVAKWAGVRPVE